MSIESFTCAYWDWKRRLRTEEPDPPDFGLTHEVGEIIARRVHREFEDGVMKNVLTRHAKHEREQHGPTAAAALDGSGAGSAGLLSDRKSVV